MKALKHCKKNKSGGFRWPLVALSTLQASLRLVCFPLPNAHVTEPLQPSSPSAFFILLAGRIQGCILKSPLTMKPCTPCPFGGNICNRMCKTGLPGVANGYSRRRFLKAAGTAAALTGINWLALARAEAASSVPVASTPLPAGPPLRLQPLLVYSLDQKRDRTSWRSYGGLRTREDVDREIAKIKAELNELIGRSEFPLDCLPLATVNSDAEAKTLAGGSCDAFLLFGASGAQQWIEAFAATKKPNILFVRHKSGPVYLWYEIAHWRLLRKSEDVKAEPNLDFDDVVVDEYGDVLWRLRALYGVKASRGTTMLALGGLKAYSSPGQELGPAKAKEAWGYTIKSLGYDELKDRLAKARADNAVMTQVERQTETLLSTPNITLDTDRKFVVNTYVALKVIKDLMTENGATNLGVADCMGGLIPILDTPPCLALAELNDSGLTAFCHTDLTHTMPGVLMRWISSKPSFVCNSHFPHHGLVTLAHCAAPRKMNGRDLEPTKLMTHYESDYGAATKVFYPKGQVVTCIVPNLRCTKWFAFRGRILDSPSFDMCRSQMDIQIDGDWQSLTREMEGFHAIVTYGDYLREAGYAAQKAGAVEWKNYSKSV